MDEHDAEPPSAAALVGERQLPETLLLSWNVDRALATARVCLRRAGCTLLELQPTALRRDAPGQSGALRMQADLQGRPAGSGRLDVTLQFADGRVFKARLATWSATPAAYANTAVAASHDDLAWPTGDAADPTPLADVATPSLAAPTSAWPERGATHEATSESKPVAEVPSHPPARPRGRRASTGTGREEA